MTKKLSFKQQMMLKREELIIDTVNGLLATKGYDAMTIDEVADTVGIAKPSLYRHFPSKEALAVAALLNIMEKTQAQIDSLNNKSALSPIEKLKQLTNWAMRLKLNNKMTNLPSENSALTTHLLNSKEYVDGLVDISDQLGEWIESAQADGSIKSDLPGIVVLYTLYARACDPVLTFLKQSELYNEEDIIEMVTKTCFEGLS